jgi:predicted transcriptional regulator of viral defense system
MLELNLMLKKFITSKSLFRAKELKSLGIHPQTIARLCARGILVNEGGGVYSSPDFDIGEHHSLAESAKRIPKGTVCLLSALGFHSIGLQLPHEVWIALPFGYSAPKIEHPPIRIIHFDRDLFGKGVDIHQIEGVDVRVTSIARTVADCFKFRNTIGTDVAVEALRTSLIKRKCTIGQIGVFAQMLRMERVIRPYVEALQ